MSFESCGNNLSVNNKEEFEKFMHYWNMVSKHELEKKIEQKVLLLDNKIICGNEKFKCNMNKGVCGL